MGTLQACSSQITLHHGSSVLDMRIVVTCTMVRKSILIAGWVNVGGGYARV
jgi:hypothetical protein